MIEKVAPRGVWRAAQHCSSSLPRFSYNRTGQELARSGDFTGENVLEAIWILNGQIMRSMWLMWLIAIGVGEIVNLRHRGP